MNIYTRKCDKYIQQGNLPSKVGVDDAEGPPVPIPNTEVKLSSAENTWLATAWEDRKTPTFVYLITQYRYSSIAQSVERMTVNHDVTGSSPVGGAIFLKQAHFGGLV